ncbi:hypothetical protein ACG7TL_007558 [Trametes sanguinea]
MEPRRDRFGREDPHGVNELIDRITAEQWEDEIIRRTHVGFVIDEKEEELQKLRDKWYAKTEDIMRPPPETLPPFREVNHRIPLIDEQKKYRYHLPRCADVVKPELLAKINRYVAAGWWRPVTCEQAAPLLCVAKKDGKLRTVVDARQRNSNTVHDLTPFPDQDLIRMDVARAKYRSKIDLSDAYEQVRIVVEDVWKTAFATPFGTFVSEVMQQGDTNAPSTFQRLMTAIFRDCIGRFVHVYLDDIFVFSDSKEEHEKHLKIVFDKLRKARLYLSRKKPFVWRKLHDKCFEEIKALACKVPILKPIDHAKNEPIWLICDASVYGLGALYGQGLNWQTCRPAGFLSKKFTSAQRAYRTYEHEALAILEGLLKWEDKLLGRHVHIVTDHKALQFLEGLARPNGRQIRWYEFLARFQYDITYVPGKLNKVADCLSRYYENDTVDDHTEEWEYVNADVRLDPDGDTLPFSRAIELKAGRVLRKSSRLMAKQAAAERPKTPLPQVVEPRVLEAEQLAQHQPPSMPKEPARSEANPKLGDALSEGPSLRLHIEGKDGFMTAVRQGYAHDSTLRKVQEQPEQHKAFAIRDGFIYTKNRRVPVHTTDTAADLALVYLREVVRLHGLPESIVSDRDSKFTSKFWQETDGLSERTIRSVTQILRSMVAPDQTDWHDKIPIAEFAINSATGASTGFAPFELNYGYLPKSLNGVKTETQFPGVKEFAQRARAYLEQAHDALIEARVAQTYQANKRRQAEPTFGIGDKVYLSTKNISMPKGRARKLIPKYIGPYAITACFPDTSNYVLDLPPELKARRVHPRFHVSLLRRHEPNDDAVFPSREALSYYDVGTDDTTEWMVDEIIGHEWNGATCRFHVRWTLGDHTWEPYEHCRDLAALDDYCRLMGQLQQQQLQQQQQQQQQLQQLPGPALAPGENNAAVSVMGQGPMETDHQAPQAAAPPQNYQPAQQQAFIPHPSHFPTAQYPGFPNFGAGYQVAPQYGQPVHVGQQPSPYQQQATMQFASLPAAPFTATSQAAALLPVLPPGMPPLMPINAQAWAPVPGQHLLVAHGGGCATCAEFVRHLAAAANEPSFQAAAAQVQAELQVRFWRHFEAHAGSGGGEARERELRERDETIERLQRELRESQESADRRAVRADEAQKKNDQLTETCKDLRQQIHKLKEGVRECEKNRARLIAELEAKDRNSRSTTEPAYPKRARERDPHEESPRRRPRGHYMDSGHAETRQLVPYSSWNAGPLSSEAGPSRSSLRDTTSSASTRLASQPIEEDSDDELIPMLPPAQFGPNNSSIWDEETRIEYDVIDEDRIKRLIARSRDRRARRNLPPPATGSRPQPGEPGIPGWPYHLLLPPTDSDPRQANHWYNHVPMTWAEARHLMRVAHTDMGEARARISDLLSQVNARPELSGIAGLQLLQSHWRNPDNRRDLPVIVGPRPASPRAFNPPGFVPASTSHLPRPLGRPTPTRQHGRTPTTTTTTAAPATAAPAANTAAGRGQPTYAEPVTAWQDWFAVHQARIPTWMDREADGRPTIASLEFHLLVRRALPARTNLQDRGRWVNMSSILFGIPGLYRHIVERGQYPISTIFAMRRYTGSLEHLTVFHVARWYAHIGVSLEQAARMVRMARRTRNERVGRMLDDTAPFDGEWNVIQDAGTVPTNAQLGPFPHGDVVAGEPPYLAGVAPIYGPADATTPAPATTIPPSAPNLGTEAAAPAGNLPIPEDEEMDDGSAATSASSLPAVDYRSDNSDVLSTPSEH